MFRQALDVAWPVCAIGVALISVFSSLVKTDERRSSVTLWDRSAQPRTPHKSHLPEKSRWRRTPFAGVPFGTVCPDGKHKRPSSLIRYHGSFWAESGRTGFGLQDIGNFWGANPHIPSSHSRLSSNLRVLDRPNKAWWGQVVCDASFAARTTPCL